MRRSIDSTGLGWTEYKLGIEGEHYTVQRQERGLANNWVLVADVAPDLSVQVYCQVDLVEMGRMFFEGVGSLEDAFAVARVLTRKSHRSGLSALSAVMNELGAVPLP